MLAAIFKIGRDLIEAKKSLDHGQFVAMLESDLPFTPRWAQRLMAVARDQRLSNTKYTSLLPPSAETLYKLTRFDDATFQRLIKNGTICPSMGQNEANKILRLTRVKEDEDRILDLWPIKGKFRTLVIDPAWEYDWLSIAGRAKPGYAMQSLDDLRQLDVKAWADEQSGCHLYCWTTNNFMAEACKLVAHWGFQHRTIITWIKEGAFGLGSYFRNSTEHMIFATLGETTTRHAAASIPTHFTAARGEHSEKPEQSYDIIRTASYPPFGEANQRQARSDFVNLFASKEIAA
jgi:N6-adenosine-specific RNA methylase IME4